MEKGTIYVAANKSLGQWNYSGLIVEITKTRQRFDLLRERGVSKFALIIPVQPATKRLSVSAILFGIVAGIIGIAAGLFLGFALGVKPQPRFMSPRLKVRLGALLLPSRCS